MANVDVEVFSPWNAVGPLKAIAAAAGTAAVLSGKSGHTGKEGAATAPAEVKESSDHSADLITLVEAGPECSTNGSAALAGKDAAADATSFAELCNTGSAWSWTNWLVKLYRYTLLVIKQVYLLFMTLTLPTNQLMVSYHSLAKQLQACQLCNRTQHVCRG